MTEPLCSHGSYAAKRGAGFFTHNGWWCTDEAVKEPAVQRQLRIRRRHLERAWAASIEKILRAKNRASRGLPTTLPVRYEIRRDGEERFGLKELRYLLPARGG
jgi:hypothetical protein